LSKTNGPAWGDVLTEDNIIRAVNQSVVEEDAVLSDGDEVAYFPPVTGG
jgi:molybdopterin synthase sulfur carrier subunit